MIQNVEDILNAQWVMTRDIGDDVVSLKLKVCDILGVLRTYVQKTHYLEQKVAELQEQVAKNGIRTRK